MTEKRCELCRHWHPEMVAQTQAGTWGRCHTVHYQVHKTEGIKCRYFEPRLTVTDIRERWTALWATTNPSKEARKMRKDWPTNMLYDQAWRELLQALGVEEE